MTDAAKSAVVDWSPPAGKGDALLGAGATPAEKILTWTVGGIGAIVVVVAAWVAQMDWNPLLYILAAAIALDVIGGVVANGLNAAKRDHFGPPSATAGTWGGRLVRRPVLFASLHVHPVIVGVLYPPHLWWWGIVWYAAILLSVVAVRASPLYLERPVALACCALAVLAATLSPAPQLWAWLPVMLMLKLALAHSVQEEPYRPRA